MKNVSAKEMLKNHYRKMAEKEAREYHLTHNYYNGKPFKTRYEDQNETVDPDEVIAKRDQDYLNTLLCPQPTLGHAFTASFTALSFPSEPAVEPVENKLEKPSKNLIRRMTAWYERYLSEGLALLLPEQSDHLSTKNIDIIQQAYPNKTIMVQNICILSAFWIRPPATWDKKGNTTLLEHLFVRYSPPLFLQKYWLKTATQKHLQWLFIYLAYTQGGSLKQLATHFSWHVKNQKLWHLLPQCKTTFSLQKAILYVELMRLGGCEEHFDALINNASYCINLLEPNNEKETAFWYSMASWLARYQLRLFGVQPTRILTWARHQYTEFNAANKCFSMTGRSLEKVLRDAIEYHAVAVERRIEMSRRAEIRRLASLERDQTEQERLQRIGMRQRTHYSTSDFYVWEKHSWDWNLRTSKGIWQISELKSTEELYDEGNAMQHCVASYDKQCHAHEAAIFSLCFNKKRKLTLEVHPIFKELSQMSGFQNRSATSQEMEIVKQWMNKIVR